MIGGGAGGGGGGPGGVGGLSAAALMVIESADATVVAEAVIVVIPPEAAAAGGGGGIFSFHVGRGSIPSSTSQLHHQPNDRICSFVQITENKRATQVTRTLPNSFHIY